MKWFNIISWYLNNLIRMDKLINNLHRPSSIQTNIWLWGNQLVKGYNRYNKKTIWDCDLKWDRRRYLRVSIQVLKLLYDGKSIRWGWFWKYCHTKRSSPKTSPTYIANKNKICLTFQATKTFFATPPSH